LRYAILFFLCCLCTGISPNGAYTSNIHSISRREGLSNGAVTAIAKDAEGYVWFATWNGLNRYDGSNIVKYTANSSPYALHNHVIRELYPTAAGPIWMLTNKGISLYDNLFDRFYSFFANESESINYENDISVCHSDSFGTLASVFEKGIFKFDTATRDFKKVNLTGKFSAEAANIKRVLFIGNIPYCISNNSVLYKLVRNQLIPMIKLSADGFISSAKGILFNNRPVLLITQRNGSAYVVDIISNKTVQLNLTDDIITSFSPSSVQDRLWVGTEKGRIYSYSISTRKTEPLEAIQNLFPNNIISARIFSIFESEHDLLWIGTDGNGVYNLKLSAYPFNYLSSQQLSYPIVRSILVTRKKDVLIGTKGGGVDIFDANGEYKKHLSIKNGLTNNSVLSFLERADGSIWVGTDGRGVDIISPGYTRIRNFPDDFIKHSTLQFASVYRILEDSDHRIFLGTSGYGVIMLQFNPNETNLANPISFEQVILDKNIGKSAQQKQIVYALAEERPGIIWIGTRGLGVYRYNTITKRVSKQFNTLTHPLQILNDDVLSLFADKKRNIWVGTSGGIYEIRPIENDSMKVYGFGMQEHFSNTSIQAIQLDNKNNLWIATNKGISCIDLMAGNVKDFNANDGLINYEYSDGASFFDIRNNQLYMGGTLGIDIIQTSQIKFSSFYPPVAINDVIIRNKPVETQKDGSPVGKINNQKQLILKYNQNALTFFITPLVFWGKERHKITYRLLNFDDNWIVTMPDQTIHFANLSPGKYRFQLRVSDENGNWSPILRDLRIEIQPPFWRTFWAIAGYIILLVAIMFFILRSYHRRNALKKEAALQEFKLKKEEELHNYKIEFFTNIAHEFRTPLTLITSYIHGLLEDEKALYAKPKLLKIHNNSVKLQRLVMDIVQFRKLEKGREQLSVQLVNPTQLAQEVMGDFELLVQKKNVQCRVESNLPEATIKTDPDKFQRILSNLVSNAIKYTRNDGTININLTLSPTELNVEVEDNGAGISPAYLTKIFEPFSNIPSRTGEPFTNYRSTGLGLAVAKGLVELLGGSITCDSKQNEWISFLCRFPLNLEINTAGLVQEDTSNYGSLSQLPEDVQLDNTEHFSPVSASDKPVILIVEDDPEILSILTAFLSARYKVLCAIHGEDALMVLSKERVDLVVSDIMMPVMDGIELIKRIRGNFDTSHLPIILVTARGEIEDRIQGLEAGADSYIPKPFHPDHLKVRIAKLLQMRKNIRKRFNEAQEYIFGVKEIQDPFFHKILNYIDANIDDEEMSSEKLCDHLSISKSSLYNKTKSLLETTPHGLIDQRRVRKAAILLQSTTLTVSEIIDQTGFRSRAHFYELFNKVFDCSPSEYRQKIVSN
jgi:signal transduction histidine kinase/ligand-binding sensor domain-containing protein/CheY-like chemotaxis protein/AraC-like DNA-binding protein